MKSFQLSVLLIFAIFQLSAQSWFTSGQNAQIMVSGVGFNNTGGALFFNHPTGIASDGTRLILCDRFNNRVLIWSSLPSQWNSAPDLVLGQETFFANDPGTSKANLNWPGNVSVAKTGVLAIADTENDRILIWKQFPIANAQPADISISLPSLTPQGSNRFEWPWGVWTNGVKLVAVATHGSAVLFWNSIPVTDNQNPDYIIQLPQFGTPRNISTDGSTFFFVGDHNAKVNEIAGTFFWNTFPTQANQPYDFYRNEWIKGVKLPDGKLVAGGLSKFYLWNSTPTNSSSTPDISFQISSYKNGDGPDIVFAGGKLFVNNYNGNNILVYNSLPIQSTQQPDFAIGSITPSTNTLDSISYIQNPVLATDGERLIATSDFDRAFWIWKTIPKKNGAKPDVKISLYGIDLAPWDNALYKGKFVATGKNKIAFWDALPLNGESPSRIFTNKIGTAQFQDIKGVALDSLHLYVADQSGSLYVWKNAPISGNENSIRIITLNSLPPNHLNSDGKYLCIAVQGNPPTVYVYKVADIAASSNPLPFKTIISGQGVPLNLPAEALTFNGALAIANSSNHSVLLWKDINDAGTANNLIILGQPNPPTYEAAIGINRLFNPASLAYAANSLWIGEVKFSSRILQFSYPQALSANELNSNSREYLLAPIFPNPFTNKINLKNASGNEHFELINSLGQSIWSGRQIEQQDFSALASGLYFLKVIDQGYGHIIKLIKK